MKVFFLRKKKQLKGKYMYVEELNSKWWNYDPIRNKIEIFLAI